MHAFPLYIASDRPVADVTEKDKQANIHLSMNQVLLL
jgi:hypothetical protein